MHSGLIFPHRPFRLNLNVQPFEADPPISRGGFCWRKSLDRGRFVAEVRGERLEKSVQGTRGSPVLKLTQVGEENILRRSRELRLRN